MQTTFIVRNLTPEALSEICAMEPNAAYLKLFKWAVGDLRHCVDVKHGTGSFGDRVRWNGIVRDGKPLSFKMEPRRGYKLFTFSEARP